MEGHGAIPKGIAQFLERGRQRVKIQIHLKGNLLNGHRADRAVLAVEHICGICNLDLGHKYEAEVVQNPELIATLQRDK